MALVGATGGGADGSSGEGWTARVGARLPPPKLDPGCRRRSWTRTAAVEAGRGLPASELDQDCGRQSWILTAAAEAGPGLPPGLDLDCCRPSWTWTVSEEAGLPLAVPDGLLPGLTARRRRPPARHHARRPV